MDGGNAFTNPTTGKIDQQRKILEELAREKKLIKSGNTLGMSSAPSSSISEGQAHVAVGRALETANKTSYGFFIHTDSAFGNVILPVIPRIPPPKTTK